MPLQLIRIAGCAACLALVGCTTPPNLGDVPEGASLVAPGQGPADARPGACYGKDTTPATIETVTERVLIREAQFAPGGGIVKPAEYATKTRQEIKGGGQPYFFEVPCAHTMTPEFIASLQRALQARDFYRGPITGRMDRRTLKAVRAFQLPNFNSDILTMDTARALGLIAVGPVPQPYATTPAPVAQF